jgi:inosose dehydratase
MDRRAFLETGLVGVALPWFAQTGVVGPVARLRFGYAGLTWRGDDRTAMDEIAAAGYRGVQLRTAAVSEWGERPDELKALLADRNLMLVALSSGVVRLNPAVEPEDIALHVRNARFVRDVGGLYLQVLDERPTGREPTADDFRRMGRLLTEIGRRTADLGVPLGYHNHMGFLGQAPEEVARVLDAADPAFVHLQLDTAHWQAAGGNPAVAVAEHAERLLFLHLKDLQRPVPGGAPDSYRFVELGQGSVDLPAVFEALDRIDFDGWGVVELDPRPDAPRTPRESALLSRRYLEAHGFSM